MRTTINYNGTEIKLSSKWAGTACPWDDGYVKQHHKVLVRIGDVHTTFRHTTFNYYCNDYELNEDGLREAFYYFLSDGIAYRNAKDIFDFADEFGYDKYEDLKRLKKAWKGCMAAYDKWTKLCDIDIYDICNWMQEEYEL